MTKHWRQGYTFSTCRRLTFGMRRLCGLGQHGRIHQKSLPSEGEITMQLKLCFPALTFALMLGFDVIAFAVDRKTETEQTKADLVEFRSYLEKNMPGKKWQIGPTRIDSEEIRK